LNLETLHAIKLSGTGELGVWLTKDIEDIEDIELSAHATM